MTRGEMIRSYRTQAGISQEAMAEAVGVSRQTVSKWENDAAVPETERLAALSRLFGVPPQALLDPGSVPPAVADNGTAAPPPPKNSGAGAADRAAPRFVSFIQEHKKQVLLILAGILIACGFGGGLWLILSGRSDGGGKTAGTDQTAVSEQMPGSVPTAVSEQTPGAGPTAKQTRYPYVLVHGLGGWGTGSGVNSFVRYWGTDTGDLAAYLREQGYEVYTPSVGPVSSAWDRACELYAILTGSTVDYGAAHAAEHRHARFGRTYAAPLLPQWDKTKKVNLVGHSFGGETVRLLASLLAYGDETEQAASPGDLSPLFEGGRQALIHSVTTLCSPHNGSSLTCILDTAGRLAGLNSTTELLATLCFATAGLTNPLNGTYDFMLDQFGVTDVSGGYSGICRAISAVISSGKDHAGYDLSPDGAAALNRRIRLCPDVYYFSYAYQTTGDSDLFYTQKPRSDTLPVLYPLALAMGAFNGTTPGGIRIDETWQKNDGLVSVISALYPFGDPNTPLPPQNEIRKGIWNIAPVRTGHHGTVIGLSADADETRAFYTELFAMIDALK